MSGKIKRKTIRRRNPVVPATRKLGHRIKPSAKRYRRRPKHPLREAVERPDRRAE